MPAFKQRRAWQRARHFDLASLVGLGRRTLTGMLMATGQQFSDWSAALFKRTREQIFAASVMGQDFEGPEFFSLRAIPKRNDGAAKTL